MRRLRLILGLGVVVLATSAGVAWATTGATTGYPQPKVVVPTPLQTPFENRYLLTAVGSGAGIRSGEMKFEFEEGSSPQFLVGISQFYLYGPTGEIETALFTFYPPTALPNGKGLGFDVLKVGASTSYGQVSPDGELRLFKPQGETVKGELELHGGGPWPVEFKVLGNARGYSASPPAAKQIKEAEPTAPGWGAKPSEYVGEYELTNGGEDPTAKAATLGPVISVAEGLGAQGTAVGGGSMTVKGNPATATVKLESGGTTHTFTLTDLAWQGDQRVAQVHTEGAGRPPVGRFEGTGAQGEVKGTLIAGPSVYKVEFKLRP
ncbi:MAG: hypothetical protein JSU06_03970 [Actinobacteria bacterium]|nr:hypothetical protein [Actinomycetota bacterium]